MGEGKGPIETDRVSVVGIDYAVVDDAEIDAENEGEFSASEGQIKLASGAPARRWSKLRHELAHAVSFEIGFRDRLVAEFGVTYDEAKQIEEAIAGHFVPAFCDTLERNGWLTPPNAPESP